MRLRVRVRWLLGCIAAAIAFWVGAWLLSDSSIRHVWADAWWLAVDFFALYHCVVTARAARQRHVRLAWWMFAAACTAWTAGMVWWAIAELVLYQLAPFPSLTDVLGWVGAPCFLMGIVFYTRSSETRALGAKQIGDILLVGAALVAIAVAVLYGPTVGATKGFVYIASALATAVIAVTTLMFGVISTWQHVAGPRRQVLATMTLAKFLLAFAAVVYAEALLQSRYQAGRWIDGLWVVAFLAIAFGARLERHVADTPIVEPQLARLDPIVPSIAVLAWIGALIAATPRVTSIEAITGGALVIAIALRIWATQQRVVELEARLAHVRKLEAVGTLAGGVAHDFNNVLAVATAGLAMVRRKIERGADVNADIDEINAALWRAADLTSQLVDLSRKREPKRAPVVPATTIERARTLLEKVLPKNVTVVVEGKATDVILVDPGGLEHALLNLGLNARDALKAKGGTITIGARRDGDRMILEVRDDGPGIPPETLRQIFEPFFTTKKTDGGTGLGLAMVEAFAIGNGGTVAVESKVGKGTTFRLVFPVEPAAATDETKRPKGAGTVVVIGREDATGLAATGALEQAGYTALVVTTAVQARGVKQVDVVVIDAAINTAGEVIRELRNAGLTPPQILITGAHDTDAGGAWVGVVRKPIDPTVMAEEVRKALPSTGG